MAIGDALAAPIEDVIRTSEELQPPVTEYIKALPSHPLNHLHPGQFSDETQTTLVVAESLVEAKGFDIENLVHHFVDWYQGQKLRSAWRFPGNTLMKACRKLASGTHWTQSGFPSAGVNAVVRTIPLSLAFWRTPQVLKDALEKSCRMTHTDSRVLACAQVLAGAVKMGLEGTEPQADLMVNMAMERAQVYSPDIVRRLGILRDVIKLEPGPALAQLGTTGFCMESVLAATYWLFRCPRKFDDLVIGAANSGGDSDAIAGVAGALYGAFYGLSGISDRWLRDLEDLPRLKQIGCDLYRLSGTAR